MKITRRQLRRLIQEAMSKEEIIGKLDKLSDSGEEGMIQASSLADALPDPETLDLDSSYEYRRQLINKLVAKRRNLTDYLKRLSVKGDGMMSPVYQRAMRYHDWNRYGQQHPNEHAMQMAMQDIQQEIPGIEAKIAELDEQIQKMIDTLGMDPATAHISSLSEAIEEKKKRKKRKKKKKSKKRSYLYPYVFGYHYDHDHDLANYGDVGFDGGGDGGGGE